jgi:hypothetical protein
VIGRQQLQGPQGLANNLLSLCNRLGYERPTPHLFFFNRHQHPFGHTSGASEIILTDPLYRLVAGGETSLWAKPSCDIFPRGDILKNMCPR